jgi:transcriptional regulator with XRE-family HTH domain
MGGGKMAGIGANIQLILDMKGMTQADLARKSGLSTAVVSQIVSGKTKDPRLSNVVMIANALGVSLDYLAGIR